VVAKPRGAALGPPCEQGSTHRECPTTHELTPTCAAIRFGHRLAGSTGLGCLACSCTASGCHSRRSAAAHTQHNTRSSGTQARGPRRLQRQCGRKCHCQRGRSARSDLSPTRRTARWHAVTDRADHHVRRRRPRWLPTQPAIRTRLPRRTPVRTGSARNERSSPRCHHDPQGRLRHRVFDPQPQTTCREADLERNGVPKPHGEHRVAPGSDRRVRALSSRSTSTRRLGPRRW